jgi:uncharacterized protein
MSNKFIKAVFIFLGWFFVALGVIGIFTPLLPATVNFLVAAWFFAKSSEKFYSWLINHPRFGNLIKDYREHRGMQLKSKITALVMLNLTISSSIIFFTEKLWLRLLLVVIALGVSIYIISLKTIKREPVNL